RSPEARGAALLSVLPTIGVPFGAIRGEATLEGLTVRGVTGETLLSLVKAGSTTEVTGLDGEEAAMRFSIRHEGLELAPSLLEDAKVPHRVVVDLGVSGLSTQALVKVLQAVSMMADEDRPSEAASQEKKQQAVQQALGASAMLNPTFHIYDI